MDAQRGMETGPDGPPICCEVVRTCLKRLAVEARQLQGSVLMPRIGCGLAGGTREEVEPIILEELTSRGVEATVHGLG